MKKIRPLGTILLDLEIIVDEMIIQHDLQFGDVLSLVNSHLEIHHPNSKEVFVEDNTSPVFSYKKDSK